MKFGAMYHVRPHHSNTVITRLSALCNVIYEMSLVLCQLLTSSCKQLTKTFGSKRPAFDLKQLCLAQQVTFHILQRNYEPLQHQVQCEVGIRIAETTVDHLSNITASKTSLGGRVFFHTNAALRKLFSSNVACLSQHLVWIPLKSLLYSESPLIKRSLPNTH